MYLSLIISAFLSSHHLWLLVGATTCQSLPGKSSHLPQDVLSHGLTCPGGLVGDHEGLALGMALTDVHGLSQVEHGKEAASVVVGRPAAVVLLGDGAVGKVLVLCGLGMELR